MDEGRKLGFDALCVRLAQQDATLANLRNRATWLLTVGGLIASFSTAVGLVRAAGSQGKPFPRWGALGLLGIMIAIGLLALFISWPVREFMFGPDGSVILQELRGGVPIDIVLDKVAGHLIAGRSRNNKGIEARMTAFRAAAILFLAEVIVFLIAVVVG